MDAFFTCRVKEDKYDDGETYIVIDVYCHVPGVVLDRPHTFGWRIGKKPGWEKLVARMTRAISDGKAITPDCVVEDKSGKTLLRTTTHIMGKYMNADLKALGY